MIDPRDVMKVDDENWEEFKKQAVKDELYYNGPGDLLDTPEGRAKFCRLNKTSVFNKPDPEFPAYKIWVYNLQGQGPNTTPTVKKSAAPTSRPDPLFLDEPAGAILAVRFRI